MWKVRERRPGMVTGMVKDILESRNNHLNIGDRDIDAIKAPSMIQSLKTVPKGCPTYERKRYRPTLTCQLCSSAVKPMRNGVDKLAACLDVERQNQMTCRSSGLISRLASSSAYR
jgi:hypothetical protein